MPSSSSPTLYEQAAALDALRAALENFIAGRAPVAGDWHAVDVKLYPYPFNDHHFLHPPTGR